MKKTDFHQKDILTVLVRFRIDLEACNQAEKRSAIWSTFYTVFKMVVPLKLNNALNKVLLSKKTVFSTVSLTNTCKNNPSP